MRFQQLKRDPNSVMRKKLVKSKKNWIVVSSLSLAGGLLLMGGPTTETVKAADVTDAATTTETVKSDAPSSTPKTSESVSTNNEPASDASSGSQEGSTSPDVETTDKSNSSILSSNVSDVTTSKEKTSDDVTPTVSNSDTETIPSADNKNVDSPLPITGNDENLSDDIAANSSEKVSDSTIGTSNISSTDTGSDVVAPIAPEEMVLKSSLAKSAMAAPEILSLSDSTVVPEVAAVTATSGNGWDVDSTGTILNITGKLDESTASTTIISSRYGTDPSKLNSDIIDDSNLAESKTNTNFGGNASTISTINISSGAIAPVNSSYLFSNMPNLTTINGLENLDTSQTTDMQGMFKNDSSLTSVDFSGNNMSAVTNMSHMFENNTSLTTTKYPNNVTHPGTGVTNIVSTTAQYANDTALTNPGVEQWQTHYILHTASMFKNASKITDLNLGGWMENNHPETGDSSLGHGMFDGTDLTSITLYNKMYFSDKTALTSTTGSTWSNLTQTFSGIPTSTNGGIGYVYKGSSSTPAGVGATNSTYTAIATAAGETVSNLITVPTNHGNITIEAEGKVGESSSITLPSTITVGGKTYSTTAKTVTATFGQTMATADKDENGNEINESNPISYVGAANASHDVPVKNPDGTSSTLNIPAGNYGDEPVTVKAPDITGYDTPNVIVTFNEDGTSTVTQDGKTIDDSNPVTYTGVKNDATSVSVKNPDGTSSTLNIPAGNYGDPDKEITLPSINGYDTPKLTVKYGEDGTPTITDQDGNKVDSDNPYTYTGVKNDATTVNVKNPDGSTTTLDIPAGKFGDKPVTVEAPEIKGYNTPSVVVTFNEDGTSTVTQDGKTIDDSTPVTYTGVENKASTVNVKNPDGSTTTLDIPAGKFGDKPVTVEAPEIKGYNTPSVVVTFNEDGTSTVTQDGKAINDSTPVTYTGVENKASTVNVKNPDGSTTTLDIPAGKFGDEPVTVKAPDITGYDTPSVVVTFNEDGTSTVTQDGKTIDDSNPVTYTGVENKASTVNVKNPDGSTTTLDIPAGKFGDEPVTVKAPDITGYDTPSVTVTYGTDGKPVVTQDGKTVDDSNPITYTGVENEASTVSVKNPDGSTTTLDIPAGHYGDEPVTVKAPDITGYNTPSVTVTYGNDGKPVVTQDGKTVDDSNPITYTGVENEASTVSVKNPDGSTTSLDIPAGNYGDPDKEITLPSIKGYDAPKLTVKYGEDGTPTITDQNGNKVDSDNPYTYTGVKNAATTVNIKNPDGSTTSLDIPAGNYGDAPVTITADPISGYTAPSVVVTYGADGTPTIANTKTPDKALSTDDVLTYTRKSSGGSSSNNNNNQNDETTAPEQHIQNIAAYSEKGTINVYALGSDNKMSALTDRGLAHQSIWYSDQKVTVDGIQYYRVATNEWVKASQVYPYEYVNMDVRTYDKTAKVLYKSEDEVVASRALAPNTSWFSDRVTYVINGEKYYRVATNEFVSANDAYVYEPTNMVVKTQNNIPATTLYTAKGEQVTNRSLAADTSWLVDSITYINGEKFYRVATNEFVKAADVDTNH